MKKDEDVGGMWRKGWRRDDGQDERLGKVCFIQKTCRHIEIFGCQGMLLYTSANGISISISKGSADLSIIRSRYQILRHLLHE